jgi:TonB family protein
VVVAEDWHKTFDSKKAITFPSRANCSLPTDLHSELNMKIMKITAGIAFILFTATAAEAQRVPRACSKGPWVEADTILSANEKRQPPTLQPITPKAPIYPVALRDRGIEGEVRVNLVIDTLGHVAAGTVLIVRETDRAFGDAVCVSLVGARFEPYAHEGTRRSVELRDIRFNFTLRR